MELSPLTQASAKITQLQARQATQNAQRAAAQDAESNASVRYANNLTNLQPEKAINNASNTLGKDDFLKILMTQLQNQDPSKPMEDKEFISQMAQFSSLEQITNMSKGFESMAKQMNTNFALSLMGKTVDIQAGPDNVVSGVVSQVTTGDSPRVAVNGTMYDSKNIIKISTTEVQ